MEISNRTKVAAGLFITTAALLIGGGLGHKWQVIVSGSGFGVISAIGLVWHRNAEAEEERRSKMTLDERVDERMEQYRKEGGTTSKWVHHSRLEEWKKENPNRDIRELYYSEGFTIDNPAFRHDVRRRMEIDMQKTGKGVYYQGRPVSNEDL